MEEIVTLWCYFNTRTSIETTLNCKRIRLLTPEIKYTEQILPLFFSVILVSTKIWLSQDFCCDNQTKFFKEFCYLNQSFIDSTKTLLRQPKFC